MWECALEIKGSSPRLFAEFCKANPGTAVAIDKQQQRALEDLGGLYAGALAGGVAAGRGWKTGKWTTTEITMLRKHFEDENYKLYVTKINMTGALSKNGWELTQNAKKTIMAKIT